MSIAKEYAGRIFLDSDFFQPDERRIAGISQNKVWLHTVESGVEIDKKTGQQSKKTIVRIVRWRAINQNADGEKVWRYFKSYNIRSPKEWETTSNLVDGLIELDNSDQGFIPISIEAYDKLYKDSNERQFENSEKRKMSAIIRDLRNINSTSEAERYLFQKKLSIMRVNVKKLESILLKYKKIISQSYTTETDVHKFLVENNAFWMFGLEYVDIKSEVGFPPGENNYVFDLMLQRHDSFWDLVELKGPYENLFDQRTKRRSKPNNKLSEAIGQIFTYLYAIDKTWDQNIVKPKAYIVIGNKETDRPSERRIFSSYLSNIDLITYFELYQRGRRLLKYIKDTALA